MKKKPPPPTELNGKEKAFVNAYIVNHEAQKAASEAGYPAKEGLSLVQKPLIKAEIVRIEAEISKNVQARVEMDAAFVLHGLRDIYDRCMGGRPFLDRRGEQMKNEEGEKLFVFDPTNAVRAIELIGKHRAIKAFEEEKINPGASNRVFNVTLQQIIYQHCASTAKKTKPLLT